MQKINVLKSKEKEILILIYGDTFSQAACCCRCSVRRSELRMDKQPIPVMVLLDLVLLDFRESLSSLVLPLLLLVKCILYGGLVLFNASESGANLLPLHLLFMVPLSRKGCTARLEVVASRRHLLCINKVTSTILVVMVEITLLPLGTCSLLLGTVRALRCGLLPWTVDNLETLRGSCMVKSLIGGVGEALWNSVCTIVACQWPLVYSCRSTSSYRYTRW
jgi:hypothetical protein